MARRVLLVSLAARCVMVDCDLGNHQLHRRHLDGSIEEYETKRLRKNPSYRRMAEGLEELIEEGFFKEKLRAGNGCDDCVPGL